MIKSILLIDDDKTINLVHSLLIKKTGRCPTVVVKDSAIDALDWLHLKATQIPSLIFLDLNMPVMDGWEFLESYRKSAYLLRLQIPIIILTSSTNPYDAVRAKNAEEVNEYFIKPLTPEKLKRLLNKYSNVQ